LDGPWGPKNMNQFALLYTPPSRPNSHRVLAQEGTQTPQPQAE